ncbi:glycerophosphodiester phosphodiesterase family protein [Flavobacterium buctense]|uniref:Glycerophosphodiester phosphodiesterase family protein n=1 Tax=Flavobacterium buctense TaxID=1648146 RepID=A0ABU9E0C8_9FLAO|nr:glycerophosphodiester phosphodiesterase family protein [Flavobacterium buctense]
MLKIGHRGAKGHAAENTLASFQKAIDLGVDMIELDIQLSLDKVPMVIHDETIDRTTSNVGSVKDYSAKELQKLGIPTLRDVFNLIQNRCDINVEIKTFSATQSILDLMSKNIFDKNKILISSFDWNALQEVRFHDNDIRIGVLTETDLDLALAFAKFIKAYSIHPYYHLLTAENVQKIKEKHFKIFPWTINEPEDITFVTSLNVDGIITDFPERL